MGFTSVQNGHKISMCHGGVKQSMLAVLEEKHLIHLFKSFTPQTVNNVPGVIVPARYTVHHTKTLPRIHINHTILDMEQFQSFSLDS